MLIRLFRKQLVSILNYFYGLEEMTSGDWGYFSGLSGVNYLFAVTTAPKYNPRPYVLTAMFLGTLGATIFCSQRSSNRLRGFYP